MAAPDPWREPTRLVSLTWGTYDDRWLAGLVFIVAGAVQVQGANAYALVFLLIGTVASAVGWSILPASGGRRVLAAIVGTASTWLLLIGPQAAWTLTASLLAWLLVRHRPARSWIVVVLPLGTGIALAQVLEEYRFLPLALGVQLVMVVASAWVARALARPRRRPSKLAAQTR